MLNPTRSVIINSVDVSDDVLEIEAVDLSLDQGMSNVQIKLSNIANKYATAWPPFGEAGLYYPGTVSFNGVQVMQFRFEGLNPQQSKQNIILVDGLVVGATPLQKQYMTNIWSQRKADDLIQDVVNYADSAKALGLSALVDVTYFSPHVGELVNYTATNEYCHDIIRKILEKEKWTATLRASGPISAALDVFPVNDSGHQHTSILQYGDTSISGKSPRDIKESPNILDITGGKSTKEPSDGDSWTEPSYLGGHSDAWSVLSGYGGLGTTANPHQCGGYCLVGAAPDLSPQNNPFTFKLDIVKVLGTYFDAKMRNLSTVNFKVATNYNLPGQQGFNVNLILEDSHGNQASTKRGTCGGQKGPMQPNVFQEIIFFVDATTQPRIPPASQGTSTCLALTKVTATPWDWTQLSKLYVVLEILPGIASTVGVAPISYYIDCFYFGQDFTPRVRVADSTRVHSYDPRMQTISAPEYTNLTDLTAYGVKLVQASGTPTYHIDQTFEFDPSVELIMAGWQLRFNMPNYGIASTVWWRVLQAGWIWNSKDGLLLHLVAIPASSGSYDYSANLSSRVWTRDRAGLDKNIIDILRKDRRRRSPELEMEPECVPAS